MDGAADKSAITRSEEKLRVIDLIKSTSSRTARQNKHSYRQIWGEKAFKRTLTIIALGMIVLVISIALTLLVESIPSMKHLGIGYLWG
jgi:ABC-type phosphate transport system permease subunit